MLLSMAPLHFIRSQWLKWGKTWLFVYVMPLVPALASHGPVASIVTSFHSLGQGNWNKVQLDLVKPLTLVSVSHDADGIISGTVAFLMWKWLKWGAAWHFWSCAAIGIDIGSMWCWWYCQWHHCIFRSWWLKWGAPWWLFWSCYAIGNDIGITWYHSIVKGITTFLTSRQSKWGPIWLFGYVTQLLLPLASHNGIGFSVSVTWWSFWSCDTIGTNITWHWQDHQWYHLHSLQKLIKMRYNMIFLIMWYHWHLSWHHMTTNSIFSVTIAFLRSRQLKWHTTWLFDHMLLLVLVLVSHDHQQHCQWHHCIP